VSSLIQALWVGLEEVLGVKGLIAERDPSIPRIAVEWDPEIAGTQLIARTITRSLSAVAKGYPDFVEYSEIKE
jgi:uncharacterized protein YsxB (DUF464 family)